MKDAKSGLQLAQRVTYLVFSMGLITLAVRPEWKAIVGGLLIGIAASLVNSWHLQWKTAKLAQLVARTQSKPRFNLGFLTRATIGVFAYVLAERVLHYNFYMTIAGLFFVQLVAIAFIGKPKPSVERGENETWNI